LPVMPILPWLALIVIVNGIGEEAGWRGYLLPRLQTLWGPAAGTAATGLVWALWHAPMFLVVATYRAMDPWTALFGFGLGILAGAFVLAHLTALARGGIVPAVLWHTLFNLATATAVGGPAAPILTVLAMGWALWLLRRPERLAVPPG
ncbi:MAG: lysostaphin resistance A-like protein, partial [Gemmobacter sp.]